MDLDHGQDDSLQGILARLVEGLAELRGFLEISHKRLDHWVADRALHGFISGAWQNGSAVIYLMERTDFLTAAYACARASFEAGQDALLVATASDYDAAGARAVVFDHLSNADLEEAMDSVKDQGIGQDKTNAYASAAIKVEKLAGAIDEQLPGRGQPLRDALAYF